MYENEIYRARYICVNCENEVTLSNYPQHGSYVCNISYNSERVKFPNDIIIDMKDYTYLDLEGLINGK